MKKAISLMELLITLAIISILAIPTIDLMSSMLVSEATFNKDIQAKQAKLNITEKITSAVREGSYIYPSGTITIPTMSSSTSVQIGNQAVAVLVPLFNSDGSVMYSNSTGETSFKGISYSIIPESTWNGSTSGKYVLVETTYNMSMIVDPEDPLKLDETPLTDWNSGSSYLLADNLKPANQSVMGTSAFDIDNNVITFGFVPTPKAIYFPSTSGTENIDDTSFVSSVIVQNIR